MKCPACGYEPVKLGEKCPNCGTFIQNPYNITFNELVNNSKMDAWREAIAFILFAITAIIYLALYT
jgi:hypothetical protein